MEKTRKTRKPPARSVEQRQNELINIAYDLAEKQIREGKASAQVITHFLKMGTIREELELQKIKKENALLEAKVDAIKDSGTIHELYENAIKAMKSYQGDDSYEDE